MTDKHTPGPWHVTPAGYIGSEHHGFVPIVTPFRQDVFKDQFGNPTDETLANARLIAAAPKMYTGHEHVILHAEDRCDCGRSYGEIAHAAIKAAKASA